MSKIAPGYPFYTYTAEERQVSQEEASSSSKLIDLLTRKVSVQEFMRTYAARLPDEAVNEVQVLINSLDPSQFGKPVSEEEKEALHAKLTSLAQIMGFKDAEGMAGIAVNRLHGYRVIQPLFDDVELEEIMINGMDEPVLVHHRKYGMCRTNITFKNDKELRGLILQFMTPSGKSFDDARLPDGSRCNVAWPPVYTEPVVTIRKFRKQPLSLIDLVEQGTMGFDLAAFLWVVVDGISLFPLNILVVGGTASGKTTTLNTLSSFIPPNERLITAEEVRELNFYGRDNWVALETSDNADLNALILNALRMRPDRVIVGEVRGSEAGNMFTAMNVGHRGSMGTMHANSARDAITRLENAPMNVPRALIPLIDLILVQHRVYDRRKGLVRRMTQASEVSRMEDQIALNDIFEWDAQSDALKRSELPSQALEKIAKGCNLSIPDVMNEVKNRKAVLEEMAREGVRLQKDINAFMNKWYAERRK
jgi:flagellar protein FlaI